MILFMITPSLYNKNLMKKIKNVNKAGESMSVVTCHWFIRRLTCQNEAHADQSHLDFIDPMTNDAPALYFVLLWRADQ
jgi:hypothetical protein